MSSTIKRQLIFLQLLAALFVAGVSCNSSESTGENDIAVTPALVAITNFYLKANDSVLSNLDSVFFSIDLNTGVIFNADSLPKGTNVSRLVPSITFGNTMYKAKLKFLKDNETDTVIDYLTNPDDSIDFTHPVILDVVAQDTVSSFTYTIKVNVHTQIPDTVIWDRLSTSPLPSTYSAPVAQKTIYKNSTAYSLIEEYNGEYTLASCRDLNEGTWEKENIIFDFNPEIESLTSTSEYFWILSEEGNLYNSIDGLQWEDTGQTWLSILGAYGESLLGVKEDELNFYHTCYPLLENFIETPLESDFPVYGTSPLGVVENEWANTDFAIFAGGKTINGTISSAVWAFDGDNWAIINDSDLPALEMPMMAHYVVYRDTPYIFLKREFDVWLLFGGVDENGAMNRKVYMTYDNGVNWSLAPEKMQLPNSVPSLKGANLIVAGYELTADLSDAWTLQEQPSKSPGSRASYTLDGNDITWVCPYLYIFGGYLTNDNLSTNIWRGVLARLTFTPII